MTRLHDPNWRGLASDNYAGAHPDVLAAVVEANGGHQISYGEDAYTARLQELVRAHFGDRAEAFPVFNGTGANVLALTAVLPRWGSVVATASAHIHTDEAGAPERMTGLKLLTVPTADGRLTPELLDTEAWGFGDEHHPQPLAVSITQSTELGTVYSPDQVRAIADRAHEHGMAVHLDGARLFNAAAALGVPLRDVTADAGVDILSLGGTKAGALGAEAVVVLDPARVDGMLFLRKMAMQLASKMRFASAQLVALLEDDLGIRLAARANATAARLRSALEGTPGMRFLQPTEANALFARLDPDAVRRIQDRIRFYTWGADPGSVRWMTAWDTTDDDVDRFADVIRSELAATATDG